MGLIGQFAQGAAPAVQQMTQTVMEGEQRSKLMQAEAKLREEMQMRAEERGRTAQRTLGKEITGRTGEILTQDRLGAEVDAQAIQPRDSATGPGTAGNLGLIQQTKEFIANEAGGVAADESAASPLTYATARQKASYETGDPEHIRAADASLHQLRSDERLDKRETTREKHEAQRHAEVISMSRRALDKADKTEERAEVRAKAQVANNLLTNNIATLKELGYEISKNQAVISDTLDDAEKVVLNKRNKDLEDQRTDIMAENKRINSMNANYLKTSEWKDVELPAKPDNANPPKYDWAALPEKVQKEFADNLKQGTSEAKIAEFDRLFGHGSAATVLAKKPGKEVVPEKAITQAEAPEQPPRGLVQQTLSDINPGESQLKYDQRKQREQEETDEKAKVKNEAEALKTPKNQAYATNEIWKIQERINKLVAEEKPATKDFTETKVRKLQADIKWYKDRYGIE